MEDVEPIDPHVNVMDPKDWVLMKRTDFDDLVARLLLAEGHAQRSWTRP